jgi:hypothetical protein
MIPRAPAKKLAELPVEWATVEIQNCMLSRVEWDRIGK